MLLIGTARRSVRDYYHRRDFLAKAATELIDVFNQSNTKTKNISTDLLCFDEPHAIIALHYDPMVHASVVLHWLE